MSTELEKLKSELEYRKTVKRKEIAIELKRAEELGDLFRENFPYDAAVADQRHNETRITNLEHAISALSEKRTNSAKVQIGSIVELQKEDKTTITVRLVDESVFRARIYTNAVTVASPVGKAIINKTVGDNVLVNTSNKKYIITKVSF